ncbi:hypothetical protein K469DRAFT_724490 [Zopfia rhizophila CBS 207.26]|uniref:MFS general substrate transporter n=1 Tax=Zopfia rhizophila CBS 207.26 TaxID=1314779 RepID=A0A6A6EBK4_9PEZI|nr:hypothetical protein K469DRAFT_724490 [Zopfia rhizophila CBS 207.26]
MSQCIRVCRTVSTTYNRDAADFKKTGTLGTIQLHISRKKCYIFTGSIVVIFICNFVTSYSFTATSLMVGVGTLYWVTVAIKYGRGDVYAISFLIFTAHSARAGTAQTYGREFAARILLAIVAGGPEVVSPLTLTDIFFRYQRGAVMAWRLIYLVATALVGVCSLIIIFTILEANPKYLAVSELEEMGIVHEIVEEQLTLGLWDSEVLETRQSTSSLNQTSYVESLKLFQRYTDEAFLTLLFRPIFPLGLPPVLWATLVGAVTTGSGHGPTLQLRDRFGMTYNLETWQSSLIYVATIIGSFSAILVDGYFSDWVADKLTVPTVLSLIYTLGAYRPIPGEIVVFQCTFRAASGLLLTSTLIDGWTNQGTSALSPPWPASSVLSFSVTIPAFFWGKRIRHPAWQWGWVKRSVHWNVDREVGE